MALSKVCADRHILWIPIVVCKRCMQNQMDIDVRYLVRPLKIKNVGFYTQNKNGDVEIPTSPLAPPSITHFLDIAYLAVISATFIPSTTVEKNIVMGHKMLAITVESPASNGSCRYPRFVNITRNHMTPTRTLTAKYTTI